MSVVVVLVGGKKVAAFCHALPEAVQCFAGGVRASSGKQIWIRQILPMTHGVGRCDVFAVVLTFGSLNGQGLYIHNVAGAEPLGQMLCASYAFLQRNVL